jgi:hypothetical protein
VLPEQAAEVGRIEEAPPCGQRDHAAVAFGRVFQVAADGSVCDSPGV